MAVWGRGCESKAPPLQRGGLPAQNLCRLMDRWSVTWMEDTWMHPTSCVLISTHTIHLLTPPIPHLMTSRPRLIGWSTNIAPIFRLEKSSPVVKEPNVFTQDKVWPPAAGLLPPGSTQPSSASFWLQLWLSWPVWSGSSWSHLVASTWPSGTSTGHHLPEDHPEPLMDRVWTVLRLDKMKVFNSCNARFN